MPAVLATVEKGHKRGQDDNCSKAPPNPNFEVQPQPASVG